MKFFKSQFLRVLAAVSMFAIAACSKSPTEILVTVNSDFPIPAGLDRIVVQSYDTSGASVSLQTFPLRASTSAAVNGVYTLPISFAVVPQSGDIARHAILEVKGYQGTVSAAVVDRKAIMAFEDGKKLNLAIFLAEACVGVTCSGDTTCDVGGQCVPIVVTQTTDDAGVDANVNDAHVTTDSGQEIADAMPHDAAMHDATLDANTLIDAGIADSGLHDAGTLDAGSHDAATADLGTPDAGPLAVPTYAATPTQIISAPDTETSFGIGGTAVSAEGSTLAVCTQNYRYIDIFVAESGVFSTTPTQRLGDSSSYICSSGGLALSEDGMILITGGLAGGSVQIYTRDGALFRTAPSAWVPIASPPVQALAIANNTIVATGSGFGVETFVSDGSRFLHTPTQSFSKPAGASENYFGQGTCLSTDVATLVVSDYSVLSPPSGWTTFAGAMDVYVGSSFSDFDTSPMWAIPPPSGIGETSPTQFTQPIAIRADGNEIAIAGYARTADNPAGYCVFIFARGPTGFTLHQTIPTYAESVALMADGTLVVSDTFTTSEIDIYAP